MRVAATVEAGVRVAVTLGTPVRVAVTVGTGVRVAPAVGVVVGVAVAVAVAVGGAGAAGSTTGSRIRSSNSTLPPPCTLRAITAAALAPVGGVSRPAICRQSVSATLNATRRVTGAMR